MKNHLNKLHRSISEKLSRGSVKPHLQSVLLHRLFPNKNSIIPKFGMIDEAFTVGDLDSMISWFLSRGYLFITPGDILNSSLDPYTNYIMLTFDEGYFNNLLALPILEKHNVKATIYVSTGHIQTGKAFWWDVVHRERSSIGWSKEAIAEEINNLTFMRFQEQEDYLINEFTERSLFPTHDLYRPMTSNELVQISKHPLIELGNHTHYHINMLLYNANELKESIDLAHETIVSLTGRPPLSFAYPHGLYDENVIEVMKISPYKLAVRTCETRMLNVDWMKEKCNYKINRKHFVGWISITDQCYNIYSGFSLFNYIKKVFIK